jgi:hypothetical protein
LLIGPHENFYRELKKSNWVTKPILWVIIKSALIDLDLVMELVTLRKELQNLGALDKKRPRQLRRGLFL